MTYKEAISYLDCFTDYEKTRDYVYNTSYFNLNRVRILLKYFDNPQNKFKSIHIAGTKGKGSTACMTAYILSASSYKVGLYTSPHLIDFRERIKVLKDCKEKTISKNNVITLVEKIKNAIINLPSYNYTTFELYTVLCFLYFAKEKVDFAVLEVGLGGRLDATNVVSPLVCGITSISYDHTKELGRTIEKIAYEKCGIIKKNSFVVSSSQKNKALKIIKKICKKRNAKLFYVGKDIKIRNRENKFNIKGLFGNYKNLSVPLIGRHQVINAATSIGIIEILTFYNILISKLEIKKGLSRTRLEGRIQIVRKRPFVIIDGAHNKDSAKCLKQTIKENFSYKKLFLIFSVFQDKDIKGILKELSPIGDVIILTKVKSKRVVEATLLIQYLKRYKNIVVCDNIERAIKYALKVAKACDLILITGSFYLVGEAIIIFKKLDKLDNFIIK